MNKKRRTYIIFASLASLFVIISSITVLIISLTRASSDLNYPTVLKEDYVDQSSTFIFSRDSGCQLYEAEAASLSGQALIEENIAASNQEVVSSMEAESTLSFTIRSTSSGMALLSIATSFVSEAGRSIEASQLFELRFNGDLIEDTRRIESNFNDYDFTENVLTPIRLRSGNNQITFVSRSNSYLVDYITLNSPEMKTSPTATMGSFSKDFFTKKGKQDIEAEYFSHQSILITKDDLASQGYASFFANSEDTLTFSINSDQATTSELALSLKLYRVNSQPLLQVRVNNVALEEQELFLADHYEDYSFGEISLKRGNNIIQVRNISGTFLLDKISLNYQYHHDPDTLLEAHEAEDAHLERGCVVIEEKNAKEGKAVAENQIDSSIHFNLKSPKNDYVHLLVRMSYVGLGQSSDNIFELTINDEVIDTSSYIINNTTSYSIYDDFYLGRIMLHEGDNDLSLFSFTGNYNVDRIVLFHNNLIDRNEHKVEGESMLLENGNKALFGKYASNNLYVGNNSVETSLHYYCYCSEEVVFSLQAQIQYQKANRISQLFTLFVNGYESQFDAYLNHSGDELLSLDKIRFKKGLNLLTIQAQSSELTIDYLLLNK